MKPPVFNKAWPEEVVALYRHDMQEIWDPSIAPQIWNQYHNQLDLYLSLPGNDKKLEILDVGCAQGTLALKLAEAGHKVSAVDLRQDFLDYAKSRYEFGDIQFLQGNVLKLELEGSFDIIYANQIIEHLVYPEKLIKNLRALLKPGGRLVITTPNWSYLKNSLPSFRELGNPEDWEHLQCTADGDGHFYAYSAEELVDIFKTCGLSGIKPSYFETPMISGHMKVRYVHAALPVSVLKSFDRAMLVIPWAAKKFAHQLMVTGCVPGKS